MKFPHLLPVIVNYLNREWADFMCPSLQLQPINLEEVIQKALAEMNLVEGTQKAVYAYSILSQFTFPSLDYDERWTVEKIAEIANIPVFYKKYLELNRLPTLNEFLKFPHLLPKLTTVLNEEWHHFFDLFNRLPEANRVESVRVVIEKLALSDEMERSYITSILQKFTYHSPIHDEFIIVQTLADIAEEPGFYQKYIDLNPTPIVDPLFVSPLTSQKRKSSETVSVMDEVTTVATQDFLTNQSKVLRSAHAVSPAASEILNVDTNAAASTKEPFRFKREALLRAINAGIRRKDSIRRFLIGIPPQYIWDVFEQAKIYVIRSLKRCSLNKEENASNHFCFFSVLASRLLVPGEKFIVIHRGLALIEWLIQPVELEGFVEKHLNSLEENERENFIRQAPLSLYEGNKDLTRAIQAYIAKRDQRQPEVLASQSQSARPF